MVRSGIALARTQGKLIGRPRQPVECCQSGRVAHARLVLGRDRTRDGCGPGYGAPGSAETKDVESADQFCRSGVFGTGNHSWPRHLGRCVLSVPESNTFAQLFGIRLTHPNIRGNLWQFSLRPTSQLADSLEGGSMELEINPRTIDQILILDCTGRMVPAFC